MAALTFADLEIRSVFSIEKILSCHFETAENEHARLYFTAQAECRQAREEIEGMLSGQKVSLHGRGESQPVFTGVIGRAAIEDAHGSYILKAEVLSNTCQLDLVKKSRSFQDTRMTYSQVVQSVLREYPKAGCVFKVGGEKAIGYPIIQYLETDWEFLKRLASHFNASLFPELHTGEPKLYFGLPQRETLHQEEISHYKVRVDEKYYRMGGETLRYRKADFLHYLFESSEAYEVGDQVELKGRTLLVVRKYCRLDKDGEILYTYDVGSVRLASQLRRYNEKIAGMSLQGSVLETYSQMVKLHLDVDPQPTAAYPYCWAPATGNLMYLMPKVGTRVALYFPSGDEGEARAVTCIRTNGGQNSASMTDISRRGLVTEHDKQLQLYADRLGLIGSGQEGTPSSIILEDGKGIALESDHPISIFAKGNVNIGGKVVKFTCKTSVMAFSKGGKPVPEEGGDEIPPVAVLVIKEGNVGGYTENLPVHMVGLTYREFPNIEDAPQKGTFNWGKFALGILAGAAVVAACVFTFGVGVIAVSAAVAVTAVAVNDVYTGNVSSMGTYFKAAQAGAVVGMIGAAAGAIGGMVVGALKLGAVGTAVVSGVAGGLSAGASTLTTDAIMNGGALALSPFGQMVSGKPMFSDGIFDKAWDNTVIFGAGGALGSYGMGMADSPVLKLLIGLASPVPFAMMGSALDDEGVSEFLPSGGGLSFDDGFGGGMGLNMLLFSGGVQLFENSPALAGAGAAGGTYGGTTAVLGGNAGAAAGSPAAAVNPAAAAGQMALYNQLAGGLAAMETLLGHLNKEEAARQQKVLEQARERVRLPGPSAGWS